MPNYRIFETDEFTKKLNKLYSRYQKVIYNKLKKQIYPQLKENPYYGNHIKKITASDPITLRYRIGDFRLFYHPDDNDKIVYILSIDNRKDAYK